MRFWSIFVVVFLTAVGCSKSDDVVVDWDTGSGWGSTASACEQYVQLVCACDSYTEADCLAVESYASSDVADDDLCQNNINNLPAECDGSDDGGDGDGNGGGGDPTCVQAGDTCALFAAHYVTCAGADATYAASLTSGAYDDAGCAETYAQFVEANCCDAL